MMDNYLGPYLLGPDGESQGVYIGDAMELSREIPDQSIDLFITSPPYNLGNSHHTGNFRHQQYDDDLPEPEYQRQQLAMLQEMYRVAKDGCSLFYNHKNRIRGGATITPYEWLLDTPWTLKQELVWFNRGPNFDKCRFYPMTERVYWMARGTNTNFHNTISHHDLFDWKAEGTGGKFTRAFPKKLVSDILTCFPSDSIVADFYGGFGTTAAVCKELRRRCLTFEIDPRSAEQARDRIKNTQAPLFVLEPDREGDK